jgi:predicted nuclease of predicted toxin-antitoxin system
VKFLVDNQLPPALARFIQAEFEVEAAHVADLGLETASAAELWRYASITGSTLISKDEDFTHMAVQTPTATDVSIYLASHHGTASKRRPLD